MLLKYYYYYYCYCYYYYYNSFMALWFVSGTIVGEPALERLNQEGKTNLDLQEQEIVSGSGIRWAICKFICTLSQTDNHASIPPLSFFQAGCLSCHPTNNIKALKACN